MIFLLGGFMLVISILDENPLFFIVGGALIMIAITDFLTRQAQTKQDSGDGLKKCPPHDWTRDANSKIYCKSCINKTDDK